MDWPTLLVMGGLIVFALLLFRRPISHAIQHRGLKTRWGEIPARSTQSQLVETDEAADNDDPMETVRRVLAAMPDSPLLREMDERIERALEDMRTSNPQQAFPVLVRALSVAVLSAQAERVYSGILGTQIAALRHLNARREIGEEIQSIRDRYYSQSAVAPDYSFENWLRWLTNQNLVVVTESLVQITDAGVYLLTYLTNEGLSEEKAG